MKNVITSILLLTRKELHTSSSSVVSKPAEDMDARLLCVLYVT